MMNEQSKSETVYQEILARIREGFWKPGEQILAERQLATLFSVSRVTVRRAVSQLVGEGLLEYRDGRLGTFVTAKVEQETSRGSRLIGIALDNYTPAFASFLLEGLHDAFWKHNYQTLYCNTHLENGNVTEKIASFIQQGVLGIIFSPLLSPSSLSVNKAILNLSREAHIPLVQLDRCISGEPFSKVQCDNTQAMDDLMENLYAKGIRRPLVLSGLVTTSTEERLCGIRKACERHGITATLLELDELEYYRQEKLVYAEGDPPGFSDYDAIIGLSQVLSKVAVRLAKHQAPHVLTAGVSASVMEAINDYSVIQPLYHIGYAAALLLIQHLESPKTPCTTILVQAQQWPNPTDKESQP
nr:GntR family transcriptional regulator [uncultured Sphaerochaeta sp.]